MAWAVAAWAVGAASGQGVTVAIAAIAVAGGCMHRAPRLALVAVVVALVATSAAWRTADAAATPLVDLAQDQRVVTARVVVDRDARAIDRFGAPAAVVGGVVTEASAGRLSITGRDHVTLFLDGEHPDLVVGRELTVTGALRQGTEHASLVVDPLMMQVSRRSASVTAAWWWESSHAVRVGVREATAHTGRAPSALVPALVTGDDAALPEDVEEEFRRTGLTHLLAVSGTNLTIVLALVLSIARGCRAPPRVLFALGLLSVVAFIMVARPDPSVLRAAGMGIVALSAAGFGSRGGVRVLAVAVIALLTIDPMLGRAAGFVLSVCATAGILVLAPPLTRRLQAWLPTPAAVAIAVPVAAQAACTPAIAALSSEVSLVAVAANVLAGPVVAPATVCGLIGGVVALVWAPAGALLGTVAGYCASWIVWVADTCARFAGASIAWSAPWWLLVLLVPVVLLVLWRAARHPVVVIGLVLGLVVAMWRPPQPGWPPPGWVMVACDVGQGDATVLRSGPAEAVVVDTGEEAQAVDRCLRGLGVRKVTALVVTHADADHVAGWPGVVSGREVGEVVVGRPGVDIPGEPTRTVAAGDVLEAGEVRAAVLWPPPTASNGEPPSEARNGLSVVLRAEVSGVTLLLSGDLGESEQQRLLATGAEVSSDVLKVAHHGSADTSARFVRAVDATVATVSAGADNDYGHPALSALAMLRDAGTRTWRTDLEGDIAVTSSEGRLSVVTRQ